MKKCAVVLIFFLLTASLFAQTAQVLEELLETKELSNQQAAWFVLEAADILNPNTSEIDAFEYALALGWIPDYAVPEGGVRLSWVSSLIVRSFNIKSGLFFLITKAPHYAYRELVSRGIIQGKTEPDMLVSGDLLLFVVNRVLSYREANQL